RGANLREVPLAGGGKVRHQQVGHGERQHRVAEELELLVVRRLARRPMNERDAELLGADEAMAERRLELRPGRVGHRRASAVACTCPPAKRRANAARLRSPSARSRRARAATTPGGWWPSSLAAVVPVRTEYGKT